MSQRKTEKVFSFRIFASSLIVFFPVFGGCALVFFFLGQFGLPWPLFLVLYALPSSPLAIVWVYWLSRSLMPITGRMLANGLKQWVLIYPLLVGFCTFWAFLSFLLEHFVPSLPAEDAHFTIPSLIIAAISVILCVGLRSTTERVLKRIFGENPEQTNVNE